MFQSFNKVRTTLIIFSLCRTKLSIRFLVLIAFFVSGNAVGQVSATPRQSVTSFQKEPTSIVSNGTTQSNNREAINEDALNKTENNLSGLKERTDDPSEGYENNKLHPEYGKYKSPLGGEELIHKREEKSKLFKNQDGSFSKTQAEYPLHYKDAQGRWMTYDSEITQNNGLIEINKTDKPVRVNTSSGENILYLTPNQYLKWGHNTIIKYENEEGAVLKTTNKSEDLNHILSSDKLTLPKYFNGLDRVQYLKYFEIKTDFILHLKPVIPQGASVLVLEDEIILPDGFSLRFYGGEKGQRGTKAEIEVYDEKGTPVGGFSMPYIFDSKIISNKDDLQNHSFIADYQLEKTTNGYRLRILVPTQWLLDDARVYPVTIDPTASNIAPSTVIGLSSNNTSSTCTATTSVTLPAGSNVVGVSFSYQITAQNSAYRSEQFSRLEGPSGNEATYSQGSGTGGTMSYSRSSSTILSGIASGTQMFTLRHYQTWSSQTTCNTTHHFLVANSFNVTVTYCSGAFATETFGNDSWNSYTYNSFNTNFTTTSPFFANYLGAITNGITSSTWNQLTANWGAGSASSNCSSTGADNFTTSHLMTRTGAVNQARWRRFTYSSDDGLRITTDNSTWNVYNNFNTSTNSGTSTPIFNAGNPLIRIDHRENGGGASVNCTVCEMNGKYEFEANKWKAFVFDDMTIEFNKYNGYFEESNLNFCHNWGSGQPTMTGERCSMTMNNDQFSVRYIRQHNFAPGNYVVRVVTDDGVRVGINSTPTENWNVTSTVFNNSTQDVTSAPIALSGTQFIYMDMRENAGNAQASFNIVKVPSAPTGITSNLTNNAICTTGGSITLTAQGAEGTVTWYSGSCGGTYVGTGNSITVSPTQNTTYFALNRNYSDVGCGNVLDQVSSCVSINVTVGITPVINAGNDVTICQGNSVQLNGSAIPLNVCSLLGSNSLTNPSCNGNYSNNSASDNDYIVNFSTSGGVSNITNNSSGYSTNSYGDFTSMIVQVSAGNSFSVSVFAGTSYNHGFRIWIDWNNNGIFEGSESVWNSGTIGTITYTGTINVPSSQSAGRYRMRVRCVYDNIPGVDDACLLFGYGEVEDYTLQVNRNDGPCPVSFSWSSTPSGFTSTSQNPTVSPTVSTTYLLTATSNGCTSAPVQVVVTISNPSITGTTNTCVGSTSDLSAGEADWVGLPTGGTLSTFGTNERIHVFNSSGTFTNPQSINAQVLVVAGGGGGGTRHAGGGGAGGMIYNSSFTVPGNVSVIVGLGGGPGVNGSNSEFSSLTAIGGGFGSTNGTPAGSGGSGGGGSNGAFGGAGTAGQGNKGGDQNNGLGCCAARGNGGGGAGAAGANTLGVVGSAGGVGLSNSITGSAVFYAGGGGGGLDGSPAYAGGNGGGGAGGTNLSLNGVNGAPNTGGGGGGGGANGATSGTGVSGGSGIVVVRYMHPKWTSSNTAVATVNELTGVVTGVAPGTVTITYYSPAGCTATTTFTVEAPSVAPTSISGGGTYCHGNSVTLTQNGGSLGTGASYQWFTGSCGGTSVGSGPSISFNPTTTTTYFVRASATTLGACPASACASTTITLPTAGTALSTSGQNATCAVSGNNWIRFYEPGGNFIGAINGNNSLTANVTMTSYVGSASSMDACDAPGNVLYRTAYMGRNWVITSTAAPTGNVSVLLPFSNGEMTALTNVAGGVGSPTGGTLSSGNPSDNIDNAAGLHSTKYSNPGAENGTPSDNCSAGSSIVIPNSGSGTLTSAPHNYGIASAQYAIFPVAGFSEFYLHGVNNSSPLPVELIGFSGTCTEEGTSLTWQTASESNNDYFTVQRSRDGVVWEDVATVDGAGNTTQTVDYHWLDEAGYGEFYYRLSQVDYNGTRTEEQLLFVDCKPEVTIAQVYPNPTQADFTVEINATEEVASVSIAIIDVTGKALVQRSTEVHAGTNSFYFNEALESGAYLIQIKLDNEVHILRLVVRN